MANPAHGNFLAGAANNAYPATAVPREIGLLERTSGLHSGIADLRLRLEVFSAKVLGAGQGIAAGNDQPPVVGLPDAVARAEAELRSCFTLINDLTDKF
jgi:hypothetical protein